MGLGSRQPDVDSGPDSNPFTWHIYRRGQDSRCRFADSSAQPAAQVPRTLRILKSTSSLSPTQRTCSTRDRVRSATTSNGQVMFRACWLRNNPGRSLNASRRSRMRERKRCCGRR